MKNTIAAHRVVLVAILLAGTALFPMQAQAWGERGHRYQAQLLMGILPPDIREFFAAAEDHPLRDTVMYPDSFEPFETELLGRRALDVLEQHAIAHRYALHSHPRGGRGPAVSFMLLTQAFGDDEPQRAAIWAGSLLHALGDDFAANHGPLIHYLTYGFRGQSVGIGEGVGLDFGDLDRAGPPAESLPNGWHGRARVLLAVACKAKRRIRFREIRPEMLTMTSSRMLPASIVTLMAMLCGMLPSPIGADDWPQWRGPQRDGVWRETGIIDHFEEDCIPAQWSVEIGPGYSGPTVAEGRVYVTDRQVDPQQTERVHCFDAETGEPLWSYEYPCQYTIGYGAGPRAAVLIDGGRAYALGAMGHLHCFQADSGEVLWKRDLKQQYSIEMPTWGLAGAPLVVDDLLVVQIGGRPEACVVAFDKRSGEEVWRALDDHASYSAPILIEQAGERVIVSWTGDSVSALDPNDGRVVWRHEFPPRLTRNRVATPVVEGDRLLLTAFYDGSLMLRLDPNSLAVEKLWHRAGRNEQNTDALHSMISTPLMLGDYIYGVDSYGELRCLEADTGERIWEDLTATPRARWGTIHFIRQADRVWLFNERGELIIAQISPGGFEELSRAQLIEPTQHQLGQRGGVCWAHPAFADRSVFVRNDERLIRACLAKEDSDI